MPNDPYVPDVSPVSGVPAQQTYFLGRYRIIDEIGLGGMASVHLARVDGLGGFQRWFAIKRIHPHLVEDETFVNMFLDEANVAARISHPNVATVFELGKHEDTYWIAMEYLHGEPLREVMRRTEEMGATMPPEIACRVIAEAADGLHAAHELQGKDGEKLNLIHRDVTPHNLFVTYEGVTKVVDFGIAKFQDRMASTQAGTLKGKLAYMSPEQVQGESIDRRTDIFALGVVLWELTTGQRLFRMDSDLDTLAKVQECNIPPPSTMVRGYPLDLEKILMQALAKNRDERFSTAREFSRALQSLLTRRGLFIANDEVASYMASIFVDRIAKREEHLRWASAVSDAAAAAAAKSSPPPTAASRTLAPPRATPPAPPRVSHSPSVPELRPASKGAPPRPAAGAPPRPSSAPAQSQPPRPAPPAYPPASRKPSMPPPPPPRGGSSYPLPPLPSAAKATPPPPQARMDEDDEDRTVQATASQQAQLDSQANYEDQTLQASAAQQAAAHAAYFDDDDDGDATIVSRSGPADSAPSSSAPPPRQVPAVLPAAGAPARLPSFTTTNNTGTNAPLPAAPRQQFAGQRTMPLSSVAPIQPARQAPTLQARPVPAAPPAGSGFPPQMPPMGPPPPLQQPPAFPDRGVPPGFNIIDPSLPPSNQSPTVGAPLWGAPLPAPPSPAPAYGPPPGFASPQGYGQPQPPYGQPAGGYGGYAPPASPYTPPPANLTATAQPQPADFRGTSSVTRSKRIPAWAVAVGSGVIALVVTGSIVLVIAILRQPRNTVARNGSPSASASAGGPTAGNAPATSGSAASPGTPSGSSQAGIFTSARAGFLAAAAPPPMTVNTDPVPTPPPSATPVDTASAAAAPAPPPPSPAPTPPTAVAVADLPQAPPPPPTPPAPTPVAVVTRPDPPPQAPVAVIRNVPREIPRETPMVASTGNGAATGYLSVICLPGCDKVEVDGQGFGASPIFKKRMSVGSHRIKLVSSNPPGTKVVSKIVVADTVAMVRESMP